MPTEESTEQIVNGFFAGKDLTVSDNAIYELRTAIGPKGNQLMHCGSVKIVGKVSAEGRNYRFELSGITDPVWRKMAAQRSNISFNIEGSNLTLHCSAESLAEDFAKLKALFEEVNLEYAKARKLVLDMAEKQDCARKAASDKAQKEADAVKEAWDALEL